MSPHRHFFSNLPYTTIRTALVSGTEQTRARYASLTAGEVASRTHRGPATTRAMYLCPAVSVAERSFPMCCAQW